MKRLKLYLKGIYCFWRCYYLARRKRHGAGGQPHNIAMWLASCDRFIVYGQLYPGSRSWKKHALTLWERNMEQSRQRWLISEERKAHEQMAKEASLPDRLP